MRKYLSMLILVVITTQLYAQGDSTLLKILRKTLYDKRVYSTVFFEYKGVGKEPFVLPNGKYAFIYPDSVFFLAYPEIGYDMSMTWANEKLIQTMTYIKNDSSTVFVKNNADLSMRFQILFDEITIHEGHAKVRFKTSCECSGGEIGTMHFFDADLLLREKDWVVEKIVTRDAFGCKATFLGRVKKMN